MSSHPTLVPDVLAALAPQHEAVARRTLEMGSEAALWRYCARLWAGTPPDIETRSLHQWQQTLGLYKGAFAAWREHGWLEYQSLGRGQPCLLGARAVFAALSMPVTWPAWQPENITDPATRGWANRLRENGVPVVGAWLDTNEVRDYLANRHGNSVALSVVRAWFLAGEINATRYATRYYARAVDVDRFMEHRVPGKRPTNLADLVSPAERHALETVKVDATVPASWRGEIEEYGSGNVARGIRRMYLRLRALGELDVSEARRKVRRYDYATELEAS